MQQIIGYMFIVVGLGFDVFGCIGLLRLPDVYNRLQATTKCVTLGTCSILLGTFVLKGLGTTGVKAILVAIFLLLTSPVAAHALARGAHKSGVKLWPKSVVDKYGEDGN
ncbi:MAG: monovalent cation/H(+) antiporter subunit G [Candidatus Omnitrophica bacterium]|nr:monovalent cation/H(+) antiporter subunit G [Candidatus Omnitrophota bacterium]